MDTVNKSQFETVLFETLNKATHTLLSVDPDAARSFAELRGKVFCVELTVPKLTLYLVPDPDGFTLCPEADRQPDVTLSGSVFAFAKLSGKGPASRVMTEGQVTIQGDAEAGQALQKIIARFDLDWEELIARIIGDTPARKLGNVLRGAADWGAKTASLSQENFADYFKEERKILPSEAAMRRFEQGVNTLRADVDRLAQRIERLRQSGAAD
jgi:ubiquinone biosynthesis protein UbiJ